MLEPQEPATAVLDETTGLPARFKLGQNYPNPFNPETEISFVLTEGTEVALKVFDVTGRLVTDLHQGHLAAGRHRAIWNGTDETGRPVSSGIYFARLVAGDFTATRKMLLLR